MTWIKSDSELSKGRKFFDLVNRLKVRPEDAFWNLHHLWYWCSDQFPDGVMKDVSDIAIARSAQWLGEPKAFVEAMVISGFIDREPGQLRLHDWEMWKADPIRKRVDRGRRADAVRTPRDQKPFPHTPYPSSDSIQVSKDNDKNKAVKETTPLQKVVLVYKIVSGFEKDDKSWDKMYFARCSKSAKQLLDFIGNWKDAGNCIQEVYEKLSGKGLTVTLETVCKHAGDWIKDRREKEAGRGILSVSSNGSM